MKIPDEFPPLTSIAEYPLHGWDYGSDYACQRPEDPACVTFDWRCPACVLAAQAHVTHNGDSDAVWRQSAVHEERKVSMTWLIDRALYWLNQEATG